MQENKNMIHIFQKIRSFNLLILLGFLIVSNLVIAQSLPIKCYENQKDYSYMWWIKTIKTGNKTFAIKTSNYVLSFDYQTFALTNLIINKGLIIKKGQKSENIVSRETNVQSFPDYNQVKLKFGMETDVGTYWAESSSGNIDDCQLIETGKYFQRRFINKLPDLIGCNIYGSGLEISSWPDRLAFILKVTPNSDFQNRGLVVDFTFPAEYSVLIEKGDIKAFKNPEDGSGYIILKSAQASGIVVSGSTVEVKSGINALWPAGKEINTGMIIYPVSSNIESRIAEIEEQENTPVVLKAIQTAPSTQNLDVKYDKDHGWHQVALRSDGNVADSPEKSNNRIERVMLSIDNPSSVDKVIRLNFAKGRLTENGSSVFGMTGISAVFRDINGNPVGIPIQLSKNWHQSTGVDLFTQPFRGSWFHGLSMLTIPAKTKINLEYTSVNALWGNVPAASHAQLCLVGWGANQQWDESAIGSWGESITYEPDLDQAGAPVLDYRPLMLQDLSNVKWGWTGNMGGADFFNYTKTSGARGWHSRIRTDYKRYSPNLTEVTYAGTMDDNSMDFEYTASIGRSDDITRGIYHIKLKVLNDVSFNDFSFFQVAAPTYHYTLSNTLAWGNETGLKNQWTASIGGTSRYVTAKQVAEGKMPWFSFTNSQFAPVSAQVSFRPANRGFVIRSWKARINGKDNVAPSFAEYNATGGHGESSGLINITPPADCSSFQTGDYVEAEIEMFLLPKSADDYYGPNQNLISALLTPKANTWVMVYREAIGNNLDVVVSSGGSLTTSYPIKINSTSNAVSFSVTGGRGYVPLTITNVGSYQSPVLYQKVSGSWQKIDQSVYGNDFWQTDFDASIGKWDITYNVNLDTPNDFRQTVEFKFESSDVTSAILPTKQLSPNFMIYPNPNQNGTFNIEMTSFNNPASNVKIIDMQGRLVYENDYSADKVIHINSNLKAGMYIVSLSNDQSLMTRKLVVD